MKVNAALAFLLLMLIPVSAVAQQTNSLMCGPYCLERICQLLNVPASLDEICTLTKYDEIRGTNMLGLYKGAQQLGLDVQPLRLTLDEICANKGYKIVFLNGNHFSLVLRSTEKYMVVQDPPKKPYLMNKTEFLSRWKGHTLVFNSNDINVQKSKKATIQNQENSRQIIIDKNEINFGTVTLGKKYKGAFKISNNGNEALRVLSVRPNCSCINAKIDNNIIPPGENASVSFEINPNGGDGGIQNYVIHTRTNVHEKSVISFNVSYSLPYKTILIPPQLVLGTTKKEQNISKRITIKVPDYGNIKAFKLICPEGISYDIESTESDSIYTSTMINVHMKTGSTFGYFSKTIHVDFDDTAFNDIAVPVSWNIISKIQAFPPKAFFGSVAASSVTVREIAITSEYTITSDSFFAQSDIDYVEARIIPTEVSNKLKLFITFNAPDNGIVVKDDIFIYQRNKTEPLAVIPCYARVKKQ